MKLAKRAFLSTVPVLTGYVILGIGFGILLSEQGYGFGWSFAMSALIYAGSMQYVALELIRSGASLATFALTTLMVNARHLFYGISMIDKYKGVGKCKPYLIFGLTDETYSLVCADPPADVVQEKRAAYWLLVTLFDHAYWITGCVLGSLLGTLLPEEFTAGLDFALTALFITVFVDQWMKTKRHLPAVVGAAASLISLLIFGQDSFLIPAMVLIVATLLIMPRAKKDRPAEGGDSRD